MTGKNSPLNNVETRHAVLASDSVEKASEHCHAHACPARARGSHVTAPLVGLGVIPAENTKTRVCFTQIKHGRVYLFADIWYMYDLPLNVTG